MLISARTSSRFPCQGGSTRQNAGVYNFDPILLVEDDPDELMIIQRVLRQERVSNHLVSVSSGEEAVDYLLRRGPYANRTEFPLPCLILLDLKLRGMSGLELLRWVRSQPELRKLPVVILTHSGSPEDMLEAYEHGANSYLVKPVDLNALQALLKTVNGYWIITVQKPIWD